jgi:hypothetical protein
MFMSVANFFSYETFFETKQTAQIYDFWLGYNFIKFKAISNLSHAAMEHPRGRVV